MGLTPEILTVHSPPPITAELPPASTQISELFAILPDLTCQPFYALNGETTDHTTPPFDCHLTFDSDGPIIFINAHPGSSTTRILTPMRIGNDTIAIIARENTQQGGDGRADFVCRSNTPSDTSFYPHFDPIHTILNKYPQTLAQEVRIREACLAMSNQITTVNIDRRIVRIQPDDRGFILLFSAEDNPLDPSNPNLLIKENETLSQGSESPLLSIPFKELMIILENQMMANLPDGSDLEPLHWDANMPIPTLHLTPELLANFPFSKQEAYTGLEASAGIGINPISPTPTPSISEAGVLLPPKDLSSNYEPPRLVETEGVTKHDINIDISCPKGTKVKILTTPITTPEAIAIYQATTSSTYLPEKINLMLKELNEQSTQFNSKLPLFLKRLLSYNTTKSYKQIDCTKAGFNDRIELVYMSNDKANNSLVIGINPNSELVVITAKASRLPDLLAPNVSVHGILDVALTNELDRQLEVASINRRGEQNHGSVMIPHNTITTIPKDTTLINLTHTASTALHQQTIPTTVIDRDGHPHYLNFTPGIPFRTTSIQYNNGVYLVTAELNFSLYGGRLDPLTQQTISDIFGPNPGEFIYLQYPLIDIYTSHRDMTIFEVDPTPTPSPRTTLYRFYNSSISIRHIKDYYDLSTRQVNRTRS